MCDTGRDEVDRHGWMWTSTDEGKLTYRRATDDEKRRGRR